jgi:hypothetical protein
VNLYPVINHVWTLQCDYLVRALGQRSEVATNLKCHWVHSPIAGRYGSSGAGDLRERLDRRKSPLTYRRRSPGRDDRGCDFHHTRKSHAHDRGTNMLTHCLVISSSRTISLYSTVIGTGFISTCSSFRFTSLRGQWLTAVNTLHVREDSICSVNVFINGCTNVIAYECMGVLKI